MQGKLLWLITVLLLSAKSKPYLAYSGEICGTTSFTESSGTIDFPNVGGFSANSTCYYLIDVGDNNLVSLRFHQFDVSTYNDFCNGAWMIISCVSNEISGVATSNSPRLCGEMKWSSTLKLYDCPVLSLQLLYNPTTGSAFKLKYEITSLSVASNSSDTSELAEITDCGQTFFTNRSGVINLPSSQNITRARINCTYTISTGDQDSLMLSLTLDVTFLDLLTLADALDGCVQNRLQIICTDDNGRHLSSSNCEIFSSDFLANPMYHHCIKLEIILQSDTFDPIDTRQIAYDMIVKNITDEEIEYDYDDEYDVRRTDSTCGNSAVFREQEGFVTTPHFPLAHPHSLNCTYLIAVGRKNTLSLKFLTFDLEGDSNVGYCFYDWLTISCLLNGTSTTNSSTLRKFCGQIKWTSGLRYSNCSSVLLQFRSDHSLARGGFKIQYSITKGSLRPNFTAIACGRTEFSESDGTITLPKNPTGYVNRINCLYTVNANASSTFALDMKALNWTRMRQEMGNCIQFYCEGERTWNSSSCRDFAGQMSQALFFYRCQKLQLSLISEFFDYSQEYRIPFKVISSDDLCGNTSFSNSNGAIILQNISSFPGLAKNCTYSIAGGINTTISISFVDSQLHYSQWRYRSCTDRVTMTCSQSPNFNPYSDQRLCAQMNWPSIVRFFNCSDLVIAFEFGDIANAAKFKLNYTVARTENRRLPEYLPELRCDVITSIRAIRLPLQSVSQISLGSFNCRHNADVTMIKKGLISVDFHQIATVFQYAQDCSQDNVTISCVSDKSTANINSEKSLTFCGGRMPTNLTAFSFTDCSNIQFALRSRAYYPVQPRSLLYRINNDECGNTSFVSPSGNITSPRFPLSYPHALNCIYNIEAGDGKAVTLRSLTFQIEGRNNVEWLDRTASIYGNNNYKFGDYHSYDRRYDSCPSDWVIFRCVSNGSVTLQNAAFINRLFCGTKTFETTIYGCQTVRLEFTTSSSGVRSSTANGFNIHYDVRRIENSDASCNGNTYFNESSGTIVSPGILQSYPSGMNCSYIITAGQSKSVMLKFLQLSLQHGTHHYADGRTTDACDRDWIQIRCWPRQSGIADQLESRKFCGTQQPFTVLLSGCGYVNVTFSSDATISSQEFRVQYTVFPAGEECGRKEFSNATGVITSPAFPSPYPHRANCTYNIEVGSNSSLTLQFLIFEVGHQHYPSYSRYSSCSNDWVKISCLSRDSRNPLIANQYLGSQLCGYKTPFNTTLYQCSRYALEFVSTGHYSKRGFQIQYTISTMDEKCGNNRFSNASGIIVSPDYPRPYTHPLDCTYYIEVGANKTLLLQFLTFGIGIYSHLQCTSDWVKIDCPSRDSDELVSTAQNFNKELCGIRSPFNLTLTGCNRAAIQLFVSRGTFIRAGFNIRYKISERSYCGYPSPTFTDAKGVIVSPNLAMEDKPANISCTYLISAQQISAISLSIVATLHRQECDNNWLSIRCLKNDVVLGSSLKLCGKRIFYKEVVFPSCSSLELKYQSAIYETNFFILYTIKGTEDVCGNSLFTKPSGVISFPKFSPTYAADFNCSYSILAGNYSAILVNVSSLADVNTNKNCSGDWIEISCRNGNRDKAFRITHGECNQLEKRSSISLTNCDAANVVFHSKNVDTGRFFQLSYGIVHPTPATKETALTTNLPSITTELCPIECQRHSKETFCKCPEQQSVQTTTSTEAPVFTNRTYGTVTTVEPVFTNTTNGTTNGTLDSSASVQTGSVVGSKSSGVLVACVVLLVLFVATVVAVAVVVWLRRRSGKRNEDETMLIYNDGGHEHSISRENPAYSPFSSEEDHQSDASSYVHMKPMASNLS